MLESLNLGLVVGLAVDYIVQIAEGYHGSDRFSRQERLEDAFIAVGTSVLSGAITTLGATSFLLISELVFFRQFGLFMFVTILLSFLVAVGIFSVLLGLIGPQGNTGDIGHLYRACVSVFKKKKENVEN